MKLGAKGERSIQKVLARSRQLLNRRESPDKYTAIHVLMANFETAYHKVTGCKIHIVYKGGYYYFDHVRWNHNRLERELVKLLKKELQLNQVGDLD
jgi:hypothetical protein